MPGREVRHILFLQIEPEKGLPGGASLWLFFNVPASVRRVSSFSPADNMLSPMTVLVSIRKNNIQY